MYSTVVSVLKFLTELFQNRISIRIKMEMVMHINNLQKLQEMFSVEICNLSRFPISVSDISASLKNPDKKETIASDIIKDHRDYPITIEPRHSFKIHLYYHFDVKRLQSVVVTTTCGKVFKERFRSSNCKRGSLNQSHSLSHRS